MTDANMVPSSPTVGETSRLKSFMGRTPGIGLLKSKFLTVLGNSNELLNGISSKLTLNISSSDSDYCDDEEEALPKFDETIDYTKIDYESRRVKARRAHEEIISGRYRLPNLAPRPRLEALRSKKATGDRSAGSTSSSSSTSSTTTSSLFSRPTNAAERSQVSSMTRSNSIESRHSGGYDRNGRAIAGARRSELDMQRDLLRATDLMPITSPAEQLLAPLTAPGQPTTSDKELAAKQHLSLEVAPAPLPATGTRVLVARRRNSNSSTLTSFRDDPEVRPSPSAESTTDWRHFIRSESQNSVPSWASSISLDCCSGEEPIKEFMKRFTELLFADPAAIGLDLKSEFGAMVRLEIGRQWFARFLLDQKAKSKQVPESTFHLLVQHFAIVLFECAECGDFAPATVLMNLSFLFHREIEVPGCDPYREYLFTFLREQPLWHSLRFWNAAYFEAGQAEREHRLAARLRRAEKHEARSRVKQEQLAVSGGGGMAHCDAEVSSSSSSHRGPAEALASPRPPQRPTGGPDEVERDLESIAFRQLGAFTCNMHSLGVPHDLCLEFFRKHSSSLNGSKDKAKLIRDNIHRMYHETDLWGAKQS